jgi:carbamoyl-phosphate synthase large subunit
MGAAEMNLLFTSSGRRVSLVQMFKKSLGRAGVTGRVVTADIQGNAPTAFVSDGHHIVPRVTDGDYLPELLRICALDDIRAIIPLIDTELALLARNKQLFAERGVTVLVPPPAITELSRDKLAAFRFFSAHGIPTPAVYAADAIPDRFPLIVKPRDGSSSLGVTAVHNREELAFFRRYIRNSMVQEFITGDEFTVDVLADLKGNIRTIVPRQRLETRAGEVSKGVTRKDPQIIQAVAEVLERFDGVIGCINLQCFRRPTGEILFIECNARFGGGAPLSIMAGADLPRWTLELLQGREFDRLDQSWQDGFTMLRYDEAIYLPGRPDAD